MDKHQKHVHGITENTAEHIAENTNQHKTQHMNQHMKHAGKQMRGVTVLAILVACLLVGIKSVAWVMTGSVALLGSLLDSVLDLMISAVNFFTVRHSLMPADHEHRFGHGKAEALAAIGQGGVIGISAVFLIIESARRFLAPVDVQHGEIGIFVIVVSIVLTVGLVLVQRRVAKKTGSIAISADSMHYEGDLYMNVAVILAIALSFYGSISYADPVLGLVVSVLLLNNARHIAMQAGDQLMDRELLDDDREAIKEIIMSHPQVRGLHDLRTRISGTQKFIQCHVELDGDLSLFVAHEISDAIELRVMQSYPEADVIIHQDPAGQEKLTKLEKT